MVIQISRREVLNNLIRFKDNLLEMRGDHGDERRQRHSSDRHSKEEEKGNKGRSYKVLLNRHTGDMRFAQKISSLESQIHKKGKRKASPEDWKEVHLIVNQKPHEGIHFEVKDASDHDLNSADIDPLAWRIAKETVEVLNIKGREVEHVEAGILPEEAVLQDLSSIHLGKQRESIEDLPGWFGQINRMQAEKVLAHQSAGTYLLRDADATTASAISNLSLTNHLEVHPYLLTLVESNGKISDILLLETSKGWTLYADDPNLKDPFYHFHSSPHALIETLSVRARRPMLSNTPHGRGGRAA